MDELKIESHTRPHVVKSPQTTALLKLRAKFVSAVADMLVVEGDLKSLDIMAQSARNLLKGGKE